MDTSYDILSINEDIGHVTLRWTDAVGEHTETIAGLFNLPVEVPNPDYQPLDVANPDYEPVYIVHTDQDGILIENPRHDPAIPLTLPNPDHDPDNPLHREPTVTQLHTTPASIRAGIEAFLAGRAVDPAPPPVTTRLIRESLASLLPGSSRRR